MAEKLEDLNLPLSVVSRIVKEALGDGVNITKEARLGLAKVASVFVLYVTSASTNRAEKENRKTVTGKDVLNAMEDIELDKFCGALTEALEAYRAHAKSRKSLTKKQDADTNDVADEAE